MGPRIAALGLIGLVACAGAPTPSRVAPSPADAPPSAPRAAEPPVPIGCQPVLVSTDASWASFHHPSVTAAGSSPHTVAHSRLVARIEADGPRIAGHAFGAPVVALASNGERLRVVTLAGGVYSLSSLDAAPVLDHDLGVRVHRIALGPPGGLVVRDAGHFGTLLAIADGRAEPIPGLPAQSVVDAAFLEARRAVVLLAGGTVGMLDTSDGSFTAIPTTDPVRSLVLGPDGVYGELARRDNAYGQPQAFRARLASGRLDVADPDQIVDLTSACQSVELGPRCTVVACDHDLSVTCDGEPLEIHSVPGREASWLLPIGLGVDDRFVLEAGGYFMASVAADGVRFEPLELPRGWSRELRSGHGDWLHLPSTRDHHAPGETDVLFERGTGETIDLGAFRGRERSELLPDGTLFQMHVVDDHPEVTLGPVPGPGAVVELPPEALDAAFLDARRGVSIGADGTSIRFTCDAGATWTAVPFEGGERVIMNVPEPYGDGLTSGLVACADDRCSIALEPPVTLDFDAARAASLPTPLAPVRAPPPPSLGRDVRRFHCRAAGPRSSWTRPEAPLVRSTDAGCVVEWGRRDAEGPYRAQAGPFPCDALPEAERRESLAVSRGGVLLGERRGSHAVWVATRATPSRFDAPGRVRALRLTGGRVLAYARAMHGPLHVAVFDASGLLARADVDFGYGDLNIGMVDGSGPPTLFVVADANDHEPRAFLLPMHSRSPEAATLTWELCPSEPPAGQTAVVAMPPLYLSGPGDSPYAYSAELRLGPAGTCVRSIRSWQGDLRSDGTRLRGAGFVCAAPPE